MAPELRGSNAHNPDYRPIVQARRRLSQVGLLLAVALLQAPRQAPAHEIFAVKLGIDFLNKTQEALLWKEVDEYAFFEALLVRCGRPSNIEKRLTAAVKDCVKPEALTKVAKVFRDKQKTYAGNLKEDACQIASQKGILKRVRVVIDDTIRTAERNCKMCLIC